MKQNRHYLNTLCHCCSWKAWAASAQSFTLRQYTDVLSSRCILNMKRLVTPNTSRERLQKNKFQKQLESWPTISLNSEGKEETLDCLRSWTELKKNEEGHWICKHLIYKDVVLCIYLNYRIFTLRLQWQVTTWNRANQNLIKTILSTIQIKI